jgi:hypothetical protein
MRSTADNIVWGGKRKKKKSSLKSKDGGFATFRNPAHHFLSIAII